MATLLRPPGPRYRIPGANLFSMRLDPLGFTTRLAREYGDIAYAKVAGQSIYLINQPDLIKDVLVTNHRNFLKGRGLERAKKLLGNGLLTSEREFHRRQRRLSQPAFHRARMTAYGATMVDYAVKLRDRWRQGTTLDISLEMMELTLSIVGKALFNAEVGSEASEIGEALTTILRMFVLMMIPFSETLERLPLPAVRRFNQARARLDATIYRIIEEHRASGRDNGDLLSMLLLAQDEEGDGGGMTDEQLRDEAMTIFLAGHETTANALTWTWYLLSEHPEVEAKLHAEIDEALNGRLPTVEDMPKLRYTEMVITESMRLYPPAYIVGRRAIEDYPMGEYIIPARSIVLASQFVMHRDARYYQDPERFDPDRWTPEFKAKLPKFAYFPFGGGPRQCIGEGFAWMEGILVLATLAQHWRLKLVPGHPIVLQPLITLRSKHGMRMTLESR